MSLVKPQGIPLNSPFGVQDEKNMAEEERNLAKAELLRQEEELASAQKDRDSIRNKLVMLERKIIVGGENLLEKAEEQVTP